MTGALFITTKKFFINFMNKETLKQIIPLLLDVEFAAGPFPEWQVSHSSSQKLHQIFGTKLETHLDRELVRLFPYYTDVLSLYGITSDGAVIRYKGVLVYFYYIE